MSQEPTLRVQINQIDHTLVPPGPLDNSSLRRVPVIRIYGASSTGQKACVHVHQVYPYFFINYNGKMNPESVNRHISQLTLSLDHAMAISMKRNPHSPKSKFIRAILLVKGVHFYGFHSSYSPFLKVVMIDPAFVTRAVTVLQSGNVMQSRFTVYESHLSYILQFMCDFGLYGCGWIDLNEVWQRGQDEEEEPQVKDNEEVARVFRVSPHFRQSCMALEVDVAAHQIMNRHKLVARNLHHKMTIPALALPPEPLIISVRELWEDERRRRIAKGLAPSPEIPVDPSESSRGFGAEWVAEARWWEEIRKRIERENDVEVEASSSEQSWGREVMSTFESVQALWERERRTRRPKPPKDPSQEPLGELEGGGYDSETDDEHSSGWNQMGNKTHDVTVDVNERMLSSQEMNQMVEMEEQQWAQLMGDARVFDKDDGDEGFYDEEEDMLLPEDGPPAELQDDDPPVSYIAREDLASEENPFIEKPATTPRKRPPSSREGSPSCKKHRTDSVDMHEPITLKRLRPLQRGNQSIRLPTSSPTSSPMSSPSKSSSMPGRAATVVPTLPASHMVQENRRELLLSSRKIGNDVSASVGPPVQDDDQQERGRKALEAGHYSLRSRDDNPVPSPQRQPLAQASEAIEPPVSIRDGNRITDDWCAVPRAVLPSTAQKYFPSSMTSSARPVAAHSTNSFPSDKDKDTGSALYMYATVPPSISELIGSTHDFHIPDKVYRGAFYSKEYDAPGKREYAGLQYQLKSGEGLSVLEDWNDGGGRESIASRSDGGTKGKANIQRWSVTSSGWEYAGFPPNPRNVRKWLLCNAAPCPTDKRKSRSQIEGPTQVNSSGIKNTLAAASADANWERQSMSVFALETLALNRDHRVPDSQVDEIVACFWSFHGSSDSLSLESTCQTGIIVQDRQLNPSRLRNIVVESVINELELINTVVDTVVELDPDILCGWEVQAASWGFLNDRGRHYGFEISDLISRAPPRDLGKNADQWGAKQTTNFAANGRHILNVWRIMRTELSLSIYSFENVAFHVLKKRVPHYSHSTLTTWVKSEVPAHTSQALRYMSDRTRMVLQILERAEVITKTAEFARVFGVDFMSVLRRGSQFKVESFMFRIGKPESLVFISPSRQDVGKQNAAECMPLIMEPLSAFYNSPLVVLDFQSLYPSIMIAYNYCYSTCLGRVTDFKGKNKFGVTELHQQPGLLETLKGHINVAPNGIIYVKSEVRKGLLSRMLTELLETRVMVKQAMKSVKDDKVLRRILDARQLGLKYIANVTYGYTGATFSGRMPAVEIADSIVQSGRETLEKAVRIIEGSKKWGAQVVYGDTDSLFIHLPGKTKEQAFRIGHDMADTITAMNPAPVKMKFEKVYLPCVLMAKKRYVGFKYENPDDKEPVFDAKGIETVRRDGVPAQQKMTETCLKILFRTQNLSQVKEYCCRSWQKILDNKVSAQDFIFAKEVKMGTYSEKGPPPPGVAVAARRLVEDPNDETQYGDRTPYVIIRGEPHSRLVDRAVSPEVLLKNSHMQLDAVYYITKVLIPPLERIFNLVGANVRAWYDEMPKAIRTETVMLSPKKATVDLGVGRFKIDEHFSSSQCLICGDITPEGICDSCHASPQCTISELLRRIQKGENRLKDVQSICASCTHSAPGEPIECESIDCAWLFERRKVERKAEALVFLQSIVDGVEEAEKVIEEDEI